MSDPDTILLESEEHMTKSVEYLSKELRGIRTGRASTALVEYIKVDYYGSPTDLKSLAAINVPEPTQLLIKPFDAGSVNDIKTAIEKSGLGLTPMVDGKQIRLSIPPPSGDRRKQLVAQAKKLGEEAKVALRNTRRDANKGADALGKGEQNVSEDEIKTLHDEIQELLKRYETQVDELVTKKTAEIEEV